MAIKYLRTGNIKNKTVLVRASLDVPVDKETGTVDDAFRLESALPTIKLLLEQGNKVIICGKRGRPEGKVLPEYSLEPAAEALASLLNLKFSKTHTTVPKNRPKGLIFYTGNLEETKHWDTIAHIPAGHVVVLENLEFYADELSNSVAFGKKLASLADVYVDDDFSKCHHVVASNGAITNYVPAYAGLLLEQEITRLNRVLERPSSPFVLMMAGIKISDKAKTLQNLGKKADTILLGGGLANLFFLSRGYEIGQSKAESAAVKLAFEMDKNFKGKIVLPTDVVVAHTSLDKDSIRSCVAHEVRKDEVILDVGPKTILQFAGHLKKAKTIVWNGPLGNFEKKPFATGTLALARIVGAVSKGKCFGVVGGGETVDAVRRAHQQDYVDHLSTGGGAMLEYLAGTKLPGIEALV